MAIDFYTHNYQIGHQVKTYSVFDLIRNESASTILLTDSLRIEIFNGKSNAQGITKYLRLRTSDNWASCEKVTGLRPTSLNRVFTGDRIVNGKKNLLVFVFSKDYKKLKVDVYRAFYPNNPNILKDIIKKNYTE